jgi:hypothetical protein
VVYLRLCGYFGDFVGIGGAFDLFFRDRKAVIGFIAVLDQMNIFVCRIHDDFAVICSGNVDEKKTESEADDKYRDIDEF